MQESNMAAGKSRAVWSSFVRWLFGRGGMKSMILVPITLVIGLGFTASWILYVQGSRDAVFAAVDGLVLESAMREASRVGSYVDSAMRLAEANAAFLGSFPGASGRTDAIRKSFRLQLLARSEVDIVSVGFADGEYAEAQRLPGGAVRTGGAGKATGGALVLERVDERGEPVSVELRRPGYDPRERPWYKRAAAAARPVWTEPYPVLSTGELTMAAVVPLMEDGRVAAVATADIGLGRLSEFLGSVAEIPGCLAVLLDEGNLLVAGSRHDEGLTASGPEGRLALADLDPVLRAAVEAGARSPGKVVSVAPGGRPYRAVLLDLGAGGPVPWRLAVAFPEDHFLAPLHAIDLRVALVLLFMLAGNLAIAFVVAHRVADPLRRLGRAVSSFEPGSGSSAGEAEALAGRSDEIGHLAVSFLSLADRLDGSFSAIRASLAEKEILLKEIHHRVKNNLQIVSSLVSFQGGAAASPLARETVERLQERIQAMAYVHEEVYLSGNFEAVDMGRYLLRVGESLCGGSLGASGPGWLGGRCAIGIKVEAGGLGLGLDRAIPLGLVANELVANALKHAFKGRSEGTVSIRFLEEGDDYRLEVADDGVGLGASRRTGEGEAGLDEAASFPRRPDGSGGLGGSLVEGLASQLRGRVEYSSGAWGSLVAVSFPRVET
ncbi:MAG TPA: histidine kinase dimerization/phosphoacceptor domain -containing protein [Spirochaetia bacterium]|nr:histidine kinase dimerization/phosphoacceptor domain -containing protein [Spirochaetales bacterium]HRY73125.1 histidine kinase dimerization/phosphoacceptor domain -containing protein [Spirochaetia bacterium]